MLAGFYFKVVFMLEKVAVFIVSAFFMAISLIVCAAPFFLPKDKDGRK
jgi:hypothetical protein